MAEEATVGSPTEGGASDGVASFPTANAEGNLHPPERTLSEEKASPSEPGPDVATPEGAASASSFASASASFTEKVENPLDVPSVAPEEKAAAPASEDLTEFCASAPGAGAEDGQPELNAVPPLEFLTDDEFLDELERRIAFCERLVGTGTGEGSALESGTFEAASSRGSLALSVRRLHEEARAAMGGSLQEFEANYSRLRTWLESGPVSAASLLLTLQAKRALVLQQADQLTATASQLQQLKALEEFVNPPQLAELEDYRKRVEHLERKGTEIACAVSALERKVQLLAASYSTSISAVSEALMQRQAAAGPKKA